MRVRHATPDDAEAIERIRTDTWRATYRGLLPDRILERLEPALQRRREGLARMPPEQFGLVVEEEGAVVGYLFGGPARTDAERFPGEVYAIYVSPGHHGRGAGRALIEAGADELLTRGSRAMTIWVLRENAPARGFYERMGGRYVRDEEREIDGARIVESGYGWDDVASLTRRSRSFGGSSGSTQRM